MSPVSASAMPPPPRAIDGGDDRTVQTSQPPQQRMPVAFQNHAGGLGLAAPDLSDWRGAEGGARARHDEAARAFRPVLDDIHRGENIVEHRFAGRVHHVRDRSA